MITRTFKHAAVAVGMAGAVSLASVTPSSAQWHGHWGPGAAIGAGIAGFALGAAAAAAAAPYYGAPYGYGYVDTYDYSSGYAPGVVVVAPGPDYSDYYAYEPYWGRRPGRCRFDIRGC